VVGEKDTIVPARFGLRLYDGYPGRKHLWLVPDAGHNVTDFLAENWPQLWAFLNTPPPPVANRSPQPNPTQ